ncbi:MAG: hypothetical protein ACI30V_00475 [Muribaculaceae bacterium]
MLHPLPKKLPNKPHMAARPTKQITLLTFEYSLDDVFRSQLHPRLACFTGPHVDDFAALV